MKLSKSDKMHPERANPAIVFGVTDTLQDGVKPARADTDPAAQRHLVLDAQK